jgi:Recombinase zinc beta ribbon domain
MVRPCRLRPACSNQLKIAVEQHIALPGGTVQPIFGDAQAALIAQQRKANVHQRGTTRWAQQTLLGGGLARCQKCVDAGRRGTLRVSSARQRSGGHYIYYACRIHEQQPSLCSGLNYVRADRLDRAVWAQVQAVLLEPGALERLAEEQATLDAGDDPTSHLAALKATHKDFAARIAAATDAVVNAPTAFVRGALMDKLAALEPALRDLSAEIADYERSARDHAARRQLLGDVRLQVQRYQALVARLDMRRPEDVPLAHGILRSLGFSVIVARAADHSIVLDIQFHVGGQAAVPWFGVPEEVDLVPAGEHGRLLSIGAPILLRSLPATEGSFAET